MGTAGGAGSGGYGNASYGGQQGDQISKALIDESEALGKKYMESYTPGAKKKQVAVSLCVCHRVLAFPNGVSDLFTGQPKGNWISRRFWRFIPAKWKREHQIRN